ncbi:MAG TPA: hypothetical protein VJA47_05060, partial [archaeon]|nr:hypothetical protein [archaeon]
NVDEDKVKSSVGLGDLYGGSGPSIIFKKRNSTDHFVKSSAVSYDESGASLPPNLFPSNFCYPPGKEFREGAKRYVCTGNCVKQEQFSVNSTEYDLRGFPCDIKINDPVKTKDDVKIEVKIKDSVTTEEDIIDCMLEKDDFVDLITPSKPGPDPVKSSPPETTVTEDDWVNIKFIDRSETAKVCSKGKLVDIEIETKDAVLEKLEIWAYGVSKESWSTYPELKIGINTAIPVQVEDTGGGIKLKYELSEPIKGVTKAELQGAVKKSDANQPIQLSVLSAGIKANNNIYCQHPNSVKRPGKCYQEADSCSPPEGGTCKGIDKPETHPEAGLPYYPSGCECVQNKDDVKIQSSPITIKIGPCPPDQVLNANETPEDTTPKSCTEGYDIICDPWPSCVGKTKVGRKCSWPSNCPAPALEKVCTSTTIPGSTQTCGNNIKEGTELCDGTDKSACSSTQTCTNCNSCTCTESWSCGSWSMCSGGTQTRTCTDANNCGTTASKPSTSQSCLPSHIEISTGIVGTPLIYGQGGFYSTPTEPCSTGIARGVKITLTEEANNLLFSNTSIARNPSAPDHDPCYQITSDDKPWKGWGGAGSGSSLWDKNARIWDTKESNWFPSITTSYDFKIYNAWNLHCTGDLVVHLYVKC